MKVKFSLYQYLNFILTGLIFAGCTIVILDIEFYQKAVIDSLSKLSFSVEAVVLFIMIGIIYELGLIINRIGSVMIEPLYKKLHFVSFNNNYKLFNDRKRDYPILDDLSREYALSRTQVSLFIILAVLSIIKHRWVSLIIFLLLVLMFSVSMNKHSKKIVKIIA